MSIFHIPRNMRCRKMEKTLQMPTIEFESLENEDNVLTCGKCKAQYQKPIIATLTSEAGTQKYFACPRCLSEVPGVRQTEHRTSEEPRQSKEMRRTNQPIPPTETTKPDTQSGAPTMCTHEIGYLKARPKNTPIPEECLTCDKMVDCMLH